MALDATNLFKVGGANPGMWIYKSTDAIGTIDDSGYFSKVTNEFIAVKTNQYERGLTKLFKEEGNE